MTDTTEGSSQSNLVKVLFSNDGEDAIAETLWAEPVGKDIYKLRNSPFFFYGASFEDIVRALPAADGMLEFAEVVDRSGSSTYRIMVRESCTKDLFDKYRQRLIALGSSLERASHHLYAIDVPLGIDIDQVVEILDDGEANDVWDWEEGYRYDDAVTRPSRHH